MSAPACGTTLARESLDPKQQADWVGQCGVPPMQISGLPTKICAPAELQQLSRRARRSRHTVAPPLQPWVTREAEKPVEPVPSTQSLGRATLAKGESTTNWGMTRIGARGTGLFRGGRRVWGGGGCAGGGATVVAEQLGHGTYYVQHAANEMTLTVHPITLLSAVRSHDPKTITPPSETDIAALHCPRACTPPPPPPATAPDGKVIDASAAIASTGYKVLVMDTGVEKTHPDLNVVEFVDFVDAEGTADHGIDGHGHGTHVGGELLG
mgnify:CR=1 FL=1